MFNILYQILPSEIVMKVLTFSRHPVADVMAQHIGKHDEKLEQWKKYCEKHSRTDSFLNNQFALFFFGQRKVAKARREQMREKDAKEDFRKLKSNYY